MPRAIPNTLADAEALETLMNRRAPEETPAALARYGADLLGRAIGREHAADPVDLGGWNLLLADIRTRGGLSTTGLIMTRMAISDVTAGR